MLARRLLLFVSALLGLALVAAALAPPRRPVAPAPPGAPGPVVTSAPPPAGREVSLSVRDRPGRVAPRLRARVGDMLLLTVHSARPDTVSLSGLTDPVPVEAGLPARLEAFLDTPGHYRIQLEDAQRRIGTLVVG